MNELKERKYDMENNQGNQIKELTLDDHKYVLDLVNMWINNADSKVSTFCGLFTIAFGVLAFLAEKILSKIISDTQVVNPVLKGIAIGLFILGAMAFLVSMWFCYRTLSPKLTSKTNEKSPCRDNNIKYSTFYGDISEFAEFREYLEIANIATRMEYMNNLIEEIHTNSQICTKKMNNYKRGIWISFATLIMEIAGGIILLIACI